MKKFILVLKITIGLIILLSVAIVVTDYAPDAVETMAIKQESEEVLDVSESIKIGIYNIGYGGLDADQDFFMDGGTGTGASSSKAIRDNIHAMTDYLKTTDRDVYLIQEVDIKSKRSFDIDEKAMITEAFPEYSSSSATYYKVPFVPLPLSNPLGKVKMELLTLTKTEMKTATRYTLPNIEEIPYKYFYLDRCMFESVIPLSNGKNLVVLNVHLSAYDTGGTVKKAQLEWIENYIEGADLDNNYYVFGGDWNLIMTDTSGEDTQNVRDYWVEKPKDFKDGGFTWVYDDGTNTVRELDGPYEKGITFERVIDGYLVSPNLEVITVETVDMDFQYSDHNPVLLEVKIKDFN